MIGQECNGKLFLRILVEVVQHMKMKKNLTFTAFLFANLGRSGQAKHTPNKNLIFRNYGQCKCKFTNNFNLERIQF